MKKTMVLGASPNPERYSNKAVRLLHSYGHEVIPVGNRKGEIEGMAIQTDKPQPLGIDTITLYLNPERQVEYYPYILGLKPNRIIFNPGAENPELSALASIQGIETTEACTLVLLRTGQY